MLNFTELAQGFALAVKTVQMYTPTHARSRQSLEALTGLLDTWLTGHSPLQVVTSAGRMFVDGTPVEGVNVHVTTLARQFAERQISGLTFHIGVTQAEVAALVDLLILKPARIEEQGGIVRAFEKLGLQNILLTQTQYREVSEGEGTGTQESAASAASTPAALAETAEGGGFADLVITPGTRVEDIGAQLQHWMGILRDLKSHATPDWNAPFPGALPPLDLGPLAPAALQLGWGALLPRPPAMDAFRQALGSLAPDRQIALVEGLPSLPPDPAGLGAALQQVAPDLLGGAAAALLSRGLAWDALRGHLYGLLSQARNGQSLVAAVAQKLMTSGVDLWQVEKLLHQLDWDTQDLEVRIRRAVEQGEFWSLSPAQRTAFLKELLTAHREDPFQVLLDQGLDRLKDEDPQRREPAVVTLCTVGHWFEDPGVPLHFQGPLTEGLVAHFGWEPEARLHEPSEGALVAILALSLERGELADVLRLLQELEGIVELLGGPQAWRRTALSRIHDRILTPSALTASLESLHLASTEALHQEVLPFFEHLGSRGIRILVEALFSDEDRRRRARLMEVIRGLGPSALPHLQENLHNPTWYIVRNALNLVADLGHVGLLKEVTGHLRHSDPRVRHAAVRATHRLGGAAAESPLLEVLTHTDPGTQEEILLVLGKIRSQRAVQVVLPLAVSPETPERLRLKAIETLGLCGGAPLIAPLTDLVRRKGRIFTTAEPLPVRVAAVQALKALGLPEATAAMAQVVREESRGDERRALLAAAGLGA